MVSNSVKLLVSLLVAFSSSLGFAEDSPAPAVVNMLKGTKWAGSFDSLRKLGTGNISIEFSPELGAGNTLQYMHKVEGGGELGTALGPFDKACEFTPRTLKITGIKIPAGYTGTIQVYKCADSPGVPLGEPLKTIPVDKITLSDDGNSLEIVANILGVDVNYHLTNETPRTPASKGASGRATAKGASNAAAAKKANAGR